MSPPELPPILSEGAEIRQLVLQAQQQGRLVGVVPTMGALHEGHLSLVEQAHQQCDVVIVTVFVNPTQFAPSEDFDRYPRDLPADAARLANRGCDYIFAPTTDEMYPPGFGTLIDVGPVARPLEGERRPTHFAGVATVVLKLFQLVPADVAFFGHKDYQQTVVVRQLVRDLNVPIAIAICPTIRETDGLAMSSRNQYLDHHQRQQAIGLIESLRMAKQMAGTGERSTSAIEAAMREHLQQYPDITLDYIAFVREGTVDPVEGVDGPTVVLIAARLGQTRLIDNLVIG